MTQKISNSVDKSAEKSKAWFEPTLPGQGPSVWYAVVPAQLLLDPGVTKTGLQVYCALALHANRVTGLCGYYAYGRYRTPGQKRLAALAGISVRSVRDGLSNLIETGWVRKRIQRYDKSLVLWLGMPEALDLVDEQGRYKGLPEAWTEGDIPDDAKTADERFAERLRASPGYDDGEVDLGPLLESEPVRRAMAPEAPRTPPAPAPAPVPEEGGLDDLAEAAPIPLSEALADVRAWHEVRSRLYTNADLSPHGFTYETPWTELCARYPEAVDVPEW